MARETSTAVDRRPLRRDAQRNRERIVASARALFAERGLATTLDDIAAHAGVGVGTVYRRYPNKGALLDELFEERIHELVTLADAAAAQPDPWPALVEFLERSEELFASDRALQDLILHPPGAQRRIARARQQLQPPLHRLIDRAKHAGDLRPDFAASDIAFIHTMLAAIIERAQTISPDLWRRYFTMIIDGLQTARSTTTPIDTPALDEHKSEAAIVAPTPH
jgi:AcrR family transcriptional regulator